MKYDITIIGAGVIGSLCARELSRYNLKICVLEASYDVACGASRANSGIVHAGFDAKEGTLKAKLNVEGCKLMPKVAQELDIPYKNTPSIVVCLNKEDRPKLEELYERGIKNGVEDLKIIEHDELLKLEPNIRSDAHAALYAKSAGIVCPYMLAIGAMENACKNGAELKLSHKVTCISKDNDFYKISTNNGDIYSEYIINAAGLYSDDIAKMYSDCDYNLTARKGEYMLFDKSVSKIINNVIFTLPTEKGKGILVAPTVDGNLLIGPNATVTEKEDASTTAQGLDEIHNGALEMVPSLPSLRSVITSFTGLRPTPDTGDFIIRFAKNHNKILTLSGIESPGLASSPAIARYVVRMLIDAGLKADENKNFDPYNAKRIVLRELTNSEKEKVIEKNALYGRIVCRCETVTEGEIVDCIKRPAGARTVDGVKRRTRSGMGRCQGGFCMPTVVNILARELGISKEEVQKNNEGSKILFNKTKNGGAF